MQLSSSGLPGDLSSFLPTTPSSPSESPDAASLLMPNAEHLGRWYSERLGKRKCWALVVEPHRQIAELIAHLLDLELGIHAVFLPRDKLVSSLFRGWTPDLILAELPAVHGIPSAEDLESLRPLLEEAQKRETPLPVILCTTYMEITPEMARSAGFAGIIYKPFLPTTLVGAVRSVLGHLDESRAVM